MTDFSGKKLKALAEKLDEPIYLVGGSVRDFLAGFTPTDLDVCAPIPVDTFLNILKENGFTVQAEYKTTGTIKFSEDGKSYEFASFRSDKYVRGEHTPTATYFTTDILLDAKRRDFKANAVYYDIKNKTFVDPLHGIDDIKNKRLSTVDTPDKVFGEDGLRLLRLARFSAQTGFVPTNDCLAGAKRNARLILDIAPERIYTELTQILTADEKNGVSDGPYQGLCVLKESGVLKELFPELMLGDKMKQRPDFHNYDVLEHTFRCVRYAPPCIRLAALFHDVGKPASFLNDGNMHRHDVLGEEIARRILSKLKAPKKVVEETCLLIRLHMYDMDGSVRENKLKKFLVKNYGILDKLLLLKQADFSACKDDLSVCPTVVRWTEVLRKMKEENTPFSLKELAVNGNDLLQIGIEKQHISIILQALLEDCVLTPSHNEKNTLLRLAKQKEKLL